MLQPNYRLHQVWRFTLRARGKLRRISSGYLLINVVDFVYIYIYITIYTMNNIIQWNCRGLRANFTDFLIIM